MELPGREKIADHLAHVDQELAAAIAAGLGLPNRRGARAAEPTARGVSHDRSSPAPSMAGQSRSAATRVIVVLAADGIGRRGG
ncbi:hypothetical protein I6A84_26650 [Frankia sp. CNm7]|uniref:hypothetical protein n=1 Tax=Frankia nepalensis TaxID=1836974 RepID=UPI001932AB57|nr:hypothetical protein [Frankia nepalensis]MBL7521565.1 hypothetical protein [Frankia nepalensis]